MNIKKIIRNVFSTLHFRSITSYRQWCQIRYHSKMYLQIQNIRYISYEYDKLSHIIVPKHIIFSSEMLTSKPLTATGIHTAGQKSTSAFNTSAIMYLWEVKLNWVNNSITFCFCTLLRSLFVIKRTIVFPLIFCPR